MRRLSRILGIRLSGGRVGWLAFVAVFAIATTGVASGTVFLESVGDALAEGALVRRPPITRSFVESFDDSFREASGELEAALAAVANLEPGPVTYAVGAQRTTAVNGDLTIKAQVRLVYRDGGIDALEVVDETNTDGVWIGERMATALGVGPGDRFTIIDPSWTLDVPVTGVYRDLDTADLGPYWSLLPEELRPRENLVFKTIDPELVIVDEETFFVLTGGLTTDAVRESSISLGIDEFPPLSGRAWWQAGSFTGSTGADLLGLADDLEDLQAEVIDPTVPLGRALLDGGLPRVRIESDLTDLNNDVTEAKSRIGPAIGSVGITVALVGLFVIGLGSWFVARRRRTEIRMWTIEGRSPLRIGASGALGAAPAAIVGAVVAVIGAPVLVRALGPSPTWHPEVVPIWSVVPFVLAGLALVGLTSGLVAQHVLDVVKRARMPRWIWDLALYGIAITLLVQLLLGDPVDPSSGELDIGALFFPVVGVAAIVALGLRGATRIMGRLRTRGNRLPTAMFLAWRRIVAAASGGAGMVFPIGVAVGVAVFSAYLVASLTGAIEAKSIVAVGSEVAVPFARTAVDTDLPDGYSMVRAGTATAQGREQVMMLVIDPDTYPDAVPWDVVFGSDLQTVLTLLADGSGERVPTVVAGPRADRLPDVGARRTQDITVAYEVVGTLDAIPLMAANRATMVMRRDTLIEWAEANSEISGWDQLALDAGDDGFDRNDLFRALLAWLVTTNSPEDVTAYLDGIGQPTDLVRARADALDGAAFTAPRWGFEYLRLLAYAAILLAIAVFAFAIAEERRRVVVAHALIQRMGVNARTSATSLAVEVLALIGLAAALGMVAAVALSLTVLGQFDPLPRLLPALTTVVPLVDFVLAGAIALIAGLAVWWSTYRTASKADIAEVLRVG